MSFWVKSKFHLERQAANCKGAAAKFWENTRRHSAAASRQSRPIPLPGFHRVFFATDGFIDNPSG
jgi:hypothetical protein